MKKLVVILVLFGLLFLACDSGSGSGGRSVDSQYRGTYVARANAMGTPIVMPYNIVINADSIRHVQGENTIATFTAWTEGPELWHINANGQTRQYGRFFNDTLTVGNTVWRRQ